MDKFDLDYLGDGVYVGHDGYQLWLTVDSHSNRELIALEPSVLEALNRYAKRTLFKEFQESSLTSRFNFLGLPCANLLKAAETVLAAEGPRDRSLANAKLREAVEAIKP